MKPTALALLVPLATATLVHSQEPTTPTTARIIGKIPDGTPAPAAPTPEYIVPPKDILETTVHELDDGTTVTINRIKPIDLPPPVDAAAPALVNSRPLPPSLNTPRPASIIVSLGATVYRSASHPPRTLVTYRPHGNGEPITFWSSADFSLFSGIPTFLATDGTKRMLSLMCSSENTDAMAAARASRGYVYEPPQIPSFPEGPASYQFVGPQPSPEDLVPIQSLHDIYNRDFTKLLAAQQSREQARIQHEADLKANPPQPQNITLNFWRTEKPAPATEGEAQ